ncbi:MAG: hypothetical protein QMD09_12935 [Desulfatibacillaceae bacterium]|nr:hypothetical protein [Desulfatibacillaceae bacterium]
MRGKTCSTPAAKQLPGCGKGQLPDLSVKRFSAQGEGKSRLILRGWLQKLKAMRCNAPMGYEYAFILICWHIAASLRKVFCPYPDKFSINALTDWLYDIKK